VRESLGDNSVRDWPKHFRLRPWCPAGDTEIVCFTYSPSAGREEKRNETGSEESSQNSAGFNAKGNADLRIHIRPVTGRMRHVLVHHHYRIGRAVGFLM